MFCRNCGSQLNDGAGFCPSCGTPVASRPAGQPSAAAKGAAAYTATAGAGAAVAAARARRAKSGKNVKVIAIAVAAVAVVAAVIAFVVVPRLGGGNVEAVELAQMSSQEARQFFSELSMYPIASGSSYYGYATSDDIAAVAAENGATTSETLEKLSETGGSIYMAMADWFGADRDEVANWTNISGFEQVRTVSKMPDVEAVKDVVKKLGGEHMVVFNSGSDNRISVIYTIGYDIVGRIDYGKDGWAGTVGRQDIVFFGEAGQQAVSAITAAIQVAGSQGESGLKDYLLSGTHTGGYMDIYDNYDILYYE